MNYLKRPAEEELLPTRASKIPRITPSQDSNLSQTWSALRGHFWSVAKSVGQNITAFIEGWLPPGLPSQITVDAFFTSGNRERR